MFAVPIDPRGRAQNGPDFQTAAADAARSLLLDHACVVQHLNVARDGLQRDLEWLGGLGKQQRTALELLEDAPADRIGERRKDAVEHVVIIFLVELSHCLAPRPVCAGFAEALRAADAFTTI